MTDNEKKLEYLESKVDKLETTLAEIKELIKARGEKSHEEPEEDELSAIERAKIKYIMDTFGFEKVHNVMSMLDWRWAFAKDGVPSIDELKSEARRLLVSACKEETDVSTGGFRAVYEKTSEWEDDDEPYLALEFVLEECEGFDGE